MREGRMPLWKRGLLNVFYQGTCLPRRWYARRRALAGMAPLGIVVFHRIADDEANHWTTSTADFARAIRWLKTHCELISLAQVQERMRRGSNPRPAISITFDDGYAENCQTALPLLVKERIPCTYFVAAGPVLGGTPFEHDLKMGNRFAPNTVEQLRHLSGAGIEIGAHTRTHADLGRIGDRRTLVDELVTARGDLEAALDHPIRYFAFPFGLRENISAEALHLAREAGYEGVCSAYGGYNFPGDDPFHLRRRGVDGPVIRLMNFALFNPLHHARASRPAPTDRLPDQAGRVLAGRPGERGDAGSPSNQCRRAASAGIPGPQITETTL